MWFFFEIKTTFHWISDISKCFRSYPIFFWIWSFQPKGKLRFSGFYLILRHLGEIFVQSWTFCWEGIVLAVFHKVVPLSLLDLIFIHQSFSFKEGYFRSSKRVFFFEKKTPKRKQPTVFVLRISRPRKCITRKSNKVENFGLFQNSHFSTKNFNFRKNKIFRFFIFRVPKRDPKGIQKGSRKLNGRPEITFFINSVFCHKLILGTIWGSAEYFGSFFQDIGDYLGFLRKFPDIITDLNSFFFQFSTEKTSKWTDLIECFIWATKIQNLSRGREDTADLWNVFFPTPS